MAENLRLIDLRIASCYEKLLAPNPEEYCTAVMRKGKIELLFSDPGGPVTQVVQA